MSEQLVKRVDVDNGTLVKAMNFFETPQKFYEQARLMLTNEEIVLIAEMGTKIRSAEELIKIVNDHGLAENAEEFIDSVWRRVVINKVEDEVTKAIKYKITNFYVRYPVFTQYEPEIYASIPKKIIDALNDWDYEVYSAIHRKTLLNKMKGIEIPDATTNQNNFLTLEEALKAIDDCETDISVVPCNCKSMVLYHHKMTDVCINLSPRQSSLNSHQSRGYGRKLTKEEARELIIKCNKSGLMQIGHLQSYCNCDGVACYPLKLAREFGTRGIYPRPYYRIEHQKEKCINCGNCTKICNFGAFAFDAYKSVNFDPDKCYGCTICTNNCPKDAIQKHKL